jgi:hypothetical protein
MPHQSCIEGVSQGDIVAVDVNGDGRPDIRTVMRGGRPYCRETDANFDGRVDIIRFFDDQGRPTRVEDDYDFDGRIDVVATYENGVIVSDMLDTNFDGRTDTWRDYENGHVSEMRRDTNSDGRVDTWERFDERGRLIYTGLDTNGDGEPDAPADAGTPGAPGGEGTVVTASFDSGVGAAAVVPTGGLGGTAPPTLPASVSDGGGSPQ